MKTLSVTEVSGPALNWLVAKCVERDDALRSALGIFTTTTGNFKNPSTNWSQGGPIIEREKIDTAFTEDGWYASMYNRMLDSTEGYAGDTFRCGGEGPTMLVAAMRCYVASKLGETVEVPEELL